MKSDDSRLVARSNDHGRLQRSDEALSPAGARCLTLDSRGGARLFGVEIVDGSSEHEGVVALDQGSRFRVDVEAGLLHEAQRAPNGRAQAPTAE